MEPIVVSGGGGQQSYVVKGAKMMCSYGNSPAILTKPNSHGIHLKGKAMLNIGDFVPMINIGSFGLCSSLANPVVASATAANLGILTPMPCVPLTTIPWASGKVDNLVEGMPALLNISTNNCMYCGKINIIDDGQ